MAFNTPTPDALGGATEILEGEFNRFDPFRKGSPIIQNVTMYLDDSNTAFHGWESVSVSRSIDSLAQMFSFEIPQKFQQTNTRFALPIGTKVSIFVNKERVITGRVEQITMDLSSTQKKITITGRSLCADLVDCTHEGKAEYNNIPFEAFVTELIKDFNIKAHYSVEPKKITTKVAIKPGDTVFEVLDKVARMQGFFWIATRGGNIRLTRAGRGKASSGIAEDFNMKVGKVRVDSTQRFRDYKVKGQLQGQQNYPGVVVAHPEGKAKDAGVLRNRPLTIVAEGNVDNALAQSRAQWEATSRIGKAFAISVAVQNWQQQNGDLWGINQLVRLKSETLGIEGDFLSTSVEYVRNNQDGTLTLMELTRSDGYAPEPVIPEGGAGANSMQGIVDRSQQNDSEAGKKLFDDFLGGF